MAKFFENTKMLKFEPKAPDLGIFGVEFLKALVIFEKAFLNFSNSKISRKTQNQMCLNEKFCKKTKLPKFETKNALFDYLWAIILRNYCHISNQHPQIFLIANLCK